MYYNILTKIQNKPLIVKINFIVKFKLFNLKPTLA
jgi:hypothetical protein